jgi:hypothetical protein
VCFDFVFISPSATSNPTIPYLRNGLWAMLMNGFDVQGIEERINLVENTSRTSYHG